MAIRETGSWAWSKRQETMRKRRAEVEREEKLWGRWVMKRKHSLVGWPIGGKSSPNGTQQVITWSHWKENRHNSIDTCPALLRIKAYCKYVFLSGSKSSIWELSDQRWRLVTPYWEYLLQQKQNSQSLGRQTDKIHVWKSESERKLTSTRH